MVEEESREQIAEIINNEEPVKEEPINEEIKEKEIPKPKAKPKVKSRAKPKIKITKEPVEEAIHKIEEQPKIEKEPAQ